MMSPDSSSHRQVAAIARLTTVGEADAVSQQGVEHGLAFLRGRGLVQIGDGDS